MVQYEWYYVSNVGVYREQQYHIGEETQTLARGEGFGGQFLPAQVLAADEKTVYFGCEDGTVCAFWFDARSETGDFAPAHYAQNGRRYPSVLLTARDDGEVPHLRKRTVPHSTLVRTGVHSNLQAKVYVRTDQGGTQPLSELRAWGLDFGDLHFEVYEGQGGHVAGETVLIDYTHKLAFTGDVYVNLKDMTPRQAEYNRYAPILMTSVDSDAALCATERREILARLGGGSWRIFSGHGAVKEYNVKIEP